MGRDENVRSALWCGSSTLAEGETQILADTEFHIAFLNIAGWGGVTKEGRPKLPRAKYKWLWRIPIENITTLNLYREQRGNKDWVLEFVLRQAADSDIRAE